MSVAQQTREVDKVKRSENGIITDPVTLPPDETVGTARRIMEQHNISGVPITVNGHLRGILTRRDLRFLTDKQPAHRRGDDPGEFGDGPGTYNAGSGRADSDGK